MKFLQILFAVVGSVSMTHALPTETTGLKARDVDCQKPQASTTPDCWNSLQMTSYLQDWWSKNEQNCSGQTFSQCFQFQQSMTGQNCTDNTIGGCTAPNAFKYQDQRVYYVLYNIYNIYEFYSNYWLAIGNANGLVESNILHIIQEFNPPKTTNVALNDLLTAISTILAFVRIPDIAGASEGGAKDAITALFTAFQQAPGVSKFLFPETGTLDSQVAQLGDIGSQASKLVNQYQHNITSTLSAVNGDFKTFLTFANTTIFSNVPFNLQVLSDNSTQTLYTYIISQVMRANNIAVAAGALNPPSDYPSGLDGDNWFDQDSKMGYSMNKLDDIHGNWTEKMNDVFNQGWTTPQLLLKGAADCNNAATSPAGFSPTSGDPSGSGAVKCLSAAQYCIYEPNNISPGDEFTNCKTQNTFGTNDCKGSDGTSESVLVPVGYIGAYDNGQRDLCAG